MPRRRIFVLFPVPGSIVIVYGHVAKAETRRAIRSASFN